MTAEDRVAEAAYLLDVPIEGARALVAANLEAKGIYTDDEREQAARHVLWTTGHREHGYEPGGFTSAMLHAWGRADWSNQARLRIGFPVYAHALDVLKHRGVEALLEWAGI